MSRFFAVPNIIATSDKLSCSERAVATYLFSLAHHSKVMMNMEFWVKVKQTTIAEHCGISTKTVSRAIEKLLRLGIIVKKMRTVKPNRHLSTYIYVLRCPKAWGNYFYCDRKIIKLLGRSTLRTYLLCCKCANSKASFFKSYSDLSKLIGIRRSEVMKAVKELVAMGVLCIKKRLTKVGDYTENLYRLCTFMKPVCKFGHKKSFFRTAQISKAMQKKQTNSEPIINRLSGFVKWFFRKKEKIRFYFFLRGGGVKNVWSIYRYPLSLANTNKLLDFSLTNKDKQ